MNSFNLLVSICLIYVIALFVVAYIAERAADRGRFNFLRSPLIYTLSISVYCTAWTYYGAVGSAARNGLEFITIYLGPTLVFIGWWWVLRKLVRIGREQRITSIADLLSSRYGKSGFLAVLVTLLAVIGTTPYIALQLQSLALSFAVFTSSGGGSAPSPTATAFYVAVGLAVFTIVFGTRNLDANERHHGVVTAIAVEAIVKLAALVSVGVFVVWGVANGPSDIFSKMDPTLLNSGEIFNNRWLTLTLLSATAILCLPRMFQVIVVENDDEKHLATASWAFPLYLFLMSLFVLPIAIAGLSTLPENANPDLFVLTVPLAQGQNNLATFAFLGGFSSATSMVIVASIALSTMMSNHIVLPLWLRANASRNPASDDVRLMLLRSRRASIAVVLALGYLYFQFTGGTGALASIGLIAFLGVAQVLPAMIGGLFWSNATRSAAIAGICTGFALWAYTLFLPSFGGTFILTEATLQNGPFGIGWLTPQNLLNVQINDPLVHAVFWSLSMNILVFVLGSVLTTPTAIERLQSVQFINVFGQMPARRGITRSTPIEDFLILAQRILGREEAMALFREQAKLQGSGTPLPEPTSEFVSALEREFSGNVGAAAAHVMMEQVAGGAEISFEDMIAVADETAQIMEYSARLETQSAELAHTAEQLRTANDKLTQLSQQKDTFLSQVSHELRTPMTSIRTFSEILRDSDPLDPDQLNKFASIIHDESIRLTRLLDDILDLSFMENGRVQLNMETVPLSSIIERAMTTTQAQTSDTNAKILRDEMAEEVMLYTDPDRLSQVLINLITNALKHCGAKAPEIAVLSGIYKDRLVIDVADNGTGISKDDIGIIFEKFSKLSSKVTAGSAGLGLPISREIVKNLGGTLSYEGTEKGAIFRISLPYTNTQTKAAE
ncbi:sensor histidine kinase [Amylibacter sp. IMCC11727]|uniref:sensor histidine kinase n=1 Tax=Amylibacter sp. IMCC11727 TaxID=3039851 RepID=UPI00244E5B36|nr:sensor histidine kinase [Amylibacter sp. IMCC11727]WGI22654.1 sensor histidine kinase [Amylibacter sp. IMCC11727]